MSVNITVSGKFSKLSQLTDPEGYKRHLEQERRTLRLKQVRAQSKEFARKIRTQVSDEKERQLRNLEAVKAQELNLWRKNMVAKKNTEYRHALNQVGAAHLAAQRENKKAKERVTVTKERSPRSPRSPLSPRLRRTKDKTEKKKGKKKKSKCKTVICRVEETKEDGYTFDGNTHKNIHIQLQGKNDDDFNCSLDTDTDEKLSNGDIIESIDLLDYSSGSLSSLNDDDNGRKDTKSTQTDSSKEPSLSRIPPVLLDVQVETVQSETINTPDHVRDKHVETNRQFEGIRCIENFMGTERAIDTAGTQTNEPNTKDAETSYTNVPEEVVDGSPTRPRYTLISEIIAKQRNAEEPKETMMIINEDPPSDKTTTVSPITSVTTHEGNAPTFSSSFPMTKFTPQPSHPRRTTTVYPTRFSQPPRPSVNSGVTVTSTTSSKDTVDKVAGESSSSVQFYDYNTKYAKKGNRPLKAVAVPEPERTEPNAMQQAALEKQRQNGREKDLEKLRRKTEERGKVALEREQVRRDFIDLNEKLDAIHGKAAPLLPTDANLHGSAYYAEKAKRKEAKMNSAIEELLSRPAIITCPDRRKVETRMTQTVASRKQNDYYLGDLNLGSRLCSGDSDNVASKSTDTDGSASILLGCIDDQRDQIRSELLQCDDEPTIINREKKEKLTQLLRRTEELRGSLLVELNKKSGGNLCEPIGDCPSARSTMEKQQPLTQQEQELKAREIALQRELAEVIQVQKNLKADQNKADKIINKAVKITAGNDQFIEHTAMGKPLEIVIKVKGDRRSSKIKAKPTHRKDDEERDKINAAFAQPIYSNDTVAAHRRSSYESNSTAYRTIPPTLPVTTDQFIDRMRKLESKKKKKQSISSETCPSTSGGTMEIKSIRINKVPKESLNPLVAQYVQRLLGMSRDSVKALEVSSSDVDTPSSSVMNVTANMASCSSGQDTSMVSEDQLQRVQQFVNENRNFICELEESIRTHSNASLETSLHRFEDIWKEKFKRDLLKEVASKQQKKSGTISNVPKSSLPAKEKYKRSATVSQSAGKPQQTQRTPKRPTTCAAEMQAPRSEKPVDKVQQKKMQAKVTKTTGRTVEKAPKDDGDGDVYATQMQLNHYAELTKNCSKRISELTELITKVRQEKQRILEVTLTSVSDNERHSTEYTDLPGGGQKRVEQKSDSSDNDASRRHVPELPSPTRVGEGAAEQEPGSVPLEKHKNTGRSRDSGISMPSRPVTALGQDTEREPPSYASSVPTTTQTMSQSTSTHHRKPRPPPPTIHRFSPQLPDDEIVHELSTIDEADTPATSRLNTSVQAAQPGAPSEAQSSAAPPRVGRPPIDFPTFEEYVKELNLDLTMLDPDQTLRMENEYIDLIQALKDGHGTKACNYEEFPTLTTYLKTLNGVGETSQSPDTIEALFASLRLAPIIAKPFPTHREYLEHLLTNSSEKLIDSASLENLTEVYHSTTTTESESETLNIEYELQRRNLLKQSFGNCSAKYGIASTSAAASKRTDKSGISSKVTEYGGDESGVDKLSSTNTDSVSEKFHQELMALGLKWTKAMHDKKKQVAALSSSTSTENPVKSIKKSSKSPNKAKKKKTNFDCLSDSESSDRPLDLRDFLTRQLLKHASSSSNSSMTGDSIRSQFFMAVLESMTPSGSPRTNENNTGSRNSRNVQNCLERQKTSTPVPTNTIDSRSTNENSKSNEPDKSQLFSGESSLSFVQYPERSRSNARNKSPNARKKSPNESGKSRKQRRERDDSEGRQ